MIHRVIAVGKWVIDVLIAEEDYDIEGVLSCMYEIDASYHWMRRANEIMKSGGMNKAFTYSNADRRRAVVVIGPTTSGKEFQDSVVHELLHLAVHIVSAEGLDVESEDPAYLAGDGARELADIICEMGCPNCNPD